MKNTQQAKMDITDSLEDTKKLQPDEASIDMPEVKDIPGQENVRPPKMSSYVDTTASSSDEEGDGVLDGLNGGEEDELQEDEESDVTPEEKELLRRSSESMSSDEDMDIQRASLDDVDDDGEPLSEPSLKDRVSGDDIDVPGSEDDDENEEIGEEDEENNNYSLGDNE
jgi:hypothetical protein